MKHKYSLNTLHLLPRYVFIKKCIETHPTQKGKKEKTKRKNKGASSSTHQQKKLPRRGEALRKSVLLAFSRYFKIYTISNEK